LRDTLHGTSTRRRRLMGSACTDGLRHAGWAGRRVPLPSPSRGLSTHAATVADAGQRRCR
jgi:hypothetical protein